MTPLEINKKIAGLKCGIGERGVSASIGDYGRPTNRVTYFLEVDDNVRVHSRFFNWAESITDAWELFEEMDGQVITQDRYNGAYSGGKWLCTYETLCPEEVLINGPQAGDTEAMEFWADPLLVASAETAPLAVCKAWLAWKENKK